MELVELNKHLGILREKEPRQIKKLTTQHKQIIILHLEGMTPSDISSHLGLSPPWICTVLRSDIAQRLIDDYYSFCDQEFKALYSLAINTIRRGLMSDDVDVALRAADKFFKAQGKYAPSIGDGKETAEDLVKKMMEVHIENININTQQNVAALNEPDESKTAISVTGSVKELEEENAIR